MVSGRATTRRARVQKFMAPVIQKIQRQPRNFATGPPNRAAKWEPEVSMTVNRPRARPRWW